MPQTQLSQTELVTIQNGLRAAAGVYLKGADAFTGEYEGRLCAQFLKQSQEVSRLADLLEQFDGATLTA